VKHDVNGPAPLIGQVALVTGCSRRGGIGHAIAAALAGAGANVAVSGRPPGSPGSPGELAVVADEIAAMGGRSLAVHGDVGVGADAERIVDEVVTELGAVDVLVNNAAAPHGADRGLSWEVPESAFDEVMRVNTKGVFLMSAAVVRHLLDRGVPGRIINIGSDVARRGIANRAAYSASKAAVVGLSQSMASELGPHGITVNVVNPGFIETGRATTGGWERAQEASRQAGFGLNVPVDRKGTPGDIARAVVFLADPASDFVTGQAVNIDGGLMMS
jgi:3-oxoacyl-[acyl-carrier protein] reductase